MDIFHHFLPFYQSVNKSTINTQPSSVFDSLSLALMLALALSLALSLPLQGA